MNETAGNARPNSSLLLGMYERMLLIRRMEERLSADKAAGKLPGAVHLYIGQEASAVGVCAHLKDTDVITSTHRGHGHFLAKGGEPRAMMAEIWAKRTGICKGMGGSMHVADVSKGVLGANGIVGGGFAIATGAAFAAKLDRRGGVSVCFFGDGAAGQGVLMETLNVATLWCLPLIFVCENNQFSEFTPTREVTAGRIADRALAFGIPTSVVDGNDVVAVWEAAAAAVERAREDAGPSFIETNTYRIQGHAEAERMLLGSGKYREQAEIDEWRKRCPVARLRALFASERESALEIGRIEEHVAKLVEEAVAFAEASEPADVKLSLELMFLNQAA